MLLSSYIYNELGQSTNGGLPPSPPGTASVYRELSAWRRPVVIGRPSSTHRALSTPPQLYIQAMWLSAFLRPFLSTVLSSSAHASGDFRFLSAAGCRQHVSSGDRWYVSLETTMREHSNDLTSHASLIEGEHESYWHWRFMISIPILSFEHHEGQSINFTTSVYYMHIVY